MDEAIRENLQQLSHRIIDVTHTVTTLVEAEQPLQSELSAANQQVREVADEYQAIVAALSGGEREQVERTHGRRVTDLRRLASRLPQRTAGQTAQRASDVPEGGGWPFLLQRQPPKSIEPQRAVPSGGSARVGNEVDAWCGTCGEITTHTVVAVVSGEPKQVICGTCNARHGYRTAPARKSGAATATAAPSSTKRSKEQVEIDRKAAERAALQQELAAAENVREFSPRERYKPGEIIQHPEHGRGKIENVLKGSMLVRFRDGLKPVNMQ